MEPEKSGSEQLSFGSVVRLIRENKPFTLLWAGDALSTAGDWLNEIGLITLIRQHTDSPLVLALYIALRDLPPAVVTPFTGPLIDKFDKRIIMMITCILRAIIVGSYSLIVYFPVLYPALFPLTFLELSLSAMFGPARSAFIPHIVAKSDLVLASSLDMMTWSAMTMVGAGLSGVLLSMFGLVLPFLLDALTFIMSFCAIFVIYLITDKELISSEDDDAVSLKGGLTSTSSSSSSSSPSSSSSTSTSTSSTKGALDDDGTELVSLTADDNALSAALDDDADDAAAKSLPLGPPSRLQSIRTGLARAWRGFAAYLHSIPQGVLTLAAMGRFCYLLLISAAAKASAAQSWAGTETAALVMMQNYNVTISEQAGAPLSIGIYFFAVGLWTAVVPAVSVMIAGNNLAMGEKMLLVGFWVQGLGAFIQPLCTNYWTLCGAASLRIAGTAAIWVWSTTTLMRLVPQHIRGRVFSFEAGVLTLSSVAMRVCVGTLMDSGVSPWGASLVPGVLSMVLALLASIYFPLCGIMSGRQPPSLFVYDMDAPQEPVLLTPGGADADTAVGVEKDGDELSLITEDDVTFR